jgi:hypothetical protein
MKNKFKLAAAGCGVAYLLSFLFLPFVSVKLVNLGIKGSDCISFSSWAWLPVIAGIAIIICSIALPPMKAVVANAVAAIIGFISFFLVRGDLGGTAGSIVGLQGITSVLSNEILTVGFGMVLAVLFGAGSAVLCYFAENAQEHHESTPGPDNGEW